MPVAFHVDTVKHSVVLLRVQQAYKIATRSTSVRASLPSVVMVIYFFEDYQHSPLCASLKCHAFFNFSVVVKYLVSTGSE